MTLNDRKLHLP